MSLGVDYASTDHNVAPNFASAYTWGARFAFIRGAYTLNGVPEVDPTLARDRAAAGAAGLQIGPYLILGWHADPVAQVAKLVAAYGQPQRGDLPPALDIEGVWGVTAAQALATIETALSALHAHYRCLERATRQCPVDSVRRLPTVAQGGLPVEGSQPAAP